MIGREDLVLEGDTSSHDADFVLRSVRLMWPNGLVRIAGSTEVLPFSEVRFPVVGLEEFLVYRDQEAVDSWRMHGATSENDSAMLHAIILQDSATLVVDQLGSTLAAAAREILNGLVRNRITLAAA